MLTLPATNLSLSALFGQTRTLGTTGFPTPSKNAVQLPLKDTSVGTTAESRNRSFQLGLLVFKKPPTLRGEQLVKGLTSHQSLPQRNHIHRHTISQRLLWGTRLRRHTRLRLFLLFRRFRRFRRLP